MFFLKIVFNVPINNFFWYKNINTEDSTIGKRVEAYFGKRKLIGLVIGEAESLPADFDKNISVRAIEKFLDTERIFTDVQLTLAKKISDFYLASFGEVCFCMLPSAKKESTQDSLGLELADKPIPELNLSDEQQLAVKRIHNAVQAHQAKNLYLFGITGSGKTEVYLQAIRRTLDLGMSVIYLVPEIALTQQTSDELIKRFGSRVAILHSGLTQKKKFTEWKRIVQGQATVVVGARSAIFAPVKDLGLIIIDEEHDGSYKSGSTPRYHARQVAMMLSNLVSCPLVMGSATPSVEAWYLMKAGAIEKLTLTKRLAGGNIPAIEIVSMQGQTGAISKKLISEIVACKAEGKQSIIFLNRRGFAHFYVCYVCGYQMLCKNCSVPITWHKKAGVMKCHYCGWQAPPPKKCPECGSVEAGYASVGTEFIENELHSFLPDYTIRRLDTDVVSGKAETLQNTINLFREKKIDILVGTQMVAKGLNFPNVKLVGIALADTGLQMPDFRANERTFALITQVAGRAGRFSPGGKVIIQTLRPSHPAIKFAQESNINAFYEYELEQRRLLGYPPFSRLLRIVFRSKDQTKCETAIEAFAAQLKKNLPSTAQLLGPSECCIAVIAGNSRFQVLLKNKTITSLQRAVRDTLAAYKVHNTVYVEIDVDPVTVL